MERPFETPHPSIQTQDLKFKLPSSKPCYSPNLSPLPMATTRSRNLKENRMSTPHTRSASVHSSSSRKSRDPQMRTAMIPLQANTKPRFSKPSNRKSASRSRINLERALASPFVSRASSPIDDQRSNTNPMDLLPQRPRLGKRGLSDTFYNPNLPSPGSQTRITENLHEREKRRAQSAHTSPSSDVLPSVLLDLNSRLKQKRRKGGHRGTVSVDGTGAVASYPQDLGGGTTMKKKHEGHQRERRTSAPSTYSRRSRPHVLPLLVGAPVGLEGSKTKRSRLTSGLEIIYNVSNNGAVSAGAGAFTAAATSHPDDDAFVLPLPPHLHNKNITTTTNSAESEMDMDWRVGIVDFNRPPSQMCHYPTTAMLSGWGGGDVFSSSGSEGSASESEEDDDDDDDQIMANPARASRTRTRTARPLTSAFRSMFDDPFDFGSVLPDFGQSTFGDGAWGISTPLKAQIQMQAREEEKERKKERKERKMMKATSTFDLRSKNHDGGLVRVRSLPAMHAMGFVGEGWMGMNDYDHEIDANEGEDQDPYEQEQEEQDMDLTTPLIIGNVDTSSASITLESSEAIQLVDKRGDATPWILDSLISPPSRYLNTQEEFGREYPDREDESAEDQDDAGNLSSNSLSSSSSSEHNFLSFPFRLSSDAHIQSQLEATTSTTATAAATASTAKRTRSGTIVPSSHRIGNISNTTDSNDPPGTRRTRSGTLVGPLPLPLAASGPGIQLVVGNGNLSIRRTRERSGTILAGLSPVSARRTRSGIVVGCPPAPLVSTPVSVSGGKSTKERGPGPEIPEKYMPTTFNSDRTDDHRSGFNYDENLDGSDVEVDINGCVDVEPHIDALYMPRQSSSPDPIDFLRLAHYQDYDGMREKHHRFGFGLTIEEREDEDPDLGGTGERIDDEMEWCIADEPPSPIVIMNKSNLEMMGQRYNKGGILSVKEGGRGNNEKRRGGIRNAKGKGKTARTKFLIDGREEEPDEFLVEPEEGEDSDDELLLRDRSTLYLGVEAG